MTSERMQAVGRGVKLLRRRAGLTLREVAERSGVNWRTIHRLEAGENIGLEKALAVTDVLGTSVEGALEWGEAAGGTDATD